MSRSDPGNVIGLDPAIKTGWAYAVDGQYVWGTVDPYDTQAMEAVIREAVDHGVTTAYVEDAYLAKHNVRTLKSLIRSQTRAVMACERYGVSIVMISATVWQAAWNIGGKRTERKAAALAVADRIAPGKKSSDEADAVLIAEYGRCQRGICAAQDAP